MNRFLLLLVLAFVPVGCADLLLTSGDSATEDGIVLTLDAFPREISPGDTARIVATLTNTNSRAVTLHFSSGCQILYYVENAAGEVVEPEGGGWVCAAVLTSIELAAGASHTRVFSWTGQRVRYDPATWQPLHEPIPSGEYRTYAALDGVVGDRRLNLRTPPIALVLR